MSEGDTMATSNSLPPKAKRIYSALALAIIYALASAYLTPARVDIPEATETETFIIRALSGMILFGVVFICAWLVSFGVSKLCGARTNVFGPVWVVAMLVSFCLLMIGMGIVATSRG
jgi:hypothetical protein